MLQRIFGAGIRQENRAWTHTRAAIRAIDDGVKRMLPPLARYVALPPNLFTKVCICASFFILIGIASSATAAPGDCQQWMAKMVSVQGQVEARAPNEARWYPATLNQTYCAGDFLRVLGDGRASVALSNETVIRLDKHTTLVLSGLKKEEASWLDILKGAVHFISRVPRSLKVKTPYVNAAVEGTEFLVRVKPNQTIVGVIEGQVAVENHLGKVVLKDGQSAIADKGKAPELRLDLKPKDAVQWSVYYPSVLPYAEGDSSQQQHAQTLAQAEKLLHTGQVQKARDIIADILKTDANNSPALALRSVIALAQNETEQAMSLATQAVQYDQQSIAAQLALSYALQARFDLPAALAVAYDALRLDKNNASSWSRVAELQLSLGRTGKALHAAKRAVELKPAQARSLTVLGFIHLSRTDIKLASESFNQAIAYDQADPLQRLGLGLAKIRAGKVAEGRREIEIAASLNPNDPIIRSYLGKAYFEEKRNKEAAIQYQLAKQLDPNDPTPWFYDSVLKLSENQPAAALEDVESSIARNDNRAVYRSRLLLDQDEAARGVSLARNYRALGFGQRALFESWNSLAVDPANHSAHRFLADAYAGVPRHEVARVSELLQSQLLQPLNVNPVRPGDAEANLLQLEDSGPNSAGLNEYNPLFARNRNAAQVSVSGGSNQTFSDEVILSGIQDKWSYSVGQYHYDTEGFGDNQDLDQDLYNVFAQYNVSNRTRIQAEFRRRKQENGDLAQRLSGNFSPSEILTLEENTQRLGIYHQLNAQHTIIASAITNDSELGLVGGFPELDAESENYRIEIQDHYTSERYRLMFGASHLNLDGATDISLILPPPFPSTVEFEDDKSTTDTAYVYLYAPIQSNLFTVFGLSYDSFQQELENQSEFVGTSIKSLDTDQYSPKLGLVWSITKNTNLRFAGFKSVMNTSVVRQTLQPTQVVGFNQLYDDPKGSDFTRVGLGLDSRLTNTVYTGVELSSRKLNKPVSLLADIGQIDQERDELSHRAYAYWNLNPRVSLSAEFTYENLDREFRVVNDSVSIPSFDLTTRTLPLQVRFNSPKGYFANLTATYAKQNFEQLENSTLTKEGDEFVMTDLSIGYRIPKRLGTVQFTVKNLLDEEFRFQDTVPDFSLPTPSRFASERAVFAQFNLVLTN